MPNWCSNTVTLTHADPAMLDRAQMAFEQGRFLDEFVPVPEALKSTTAGFHADRAVQDQAETLQEINTAVYGYASWYDFCVNEWGTKWDVGGDNSGDLDRVDANTLNLNFDSAWAPPLAAYAKFKDLGFVIDATFWEPGCAFVGAWHDGHEQSYDYSDATAATVRDIIGEELDELYGISESMEQWEEDAE